MELYLVQGQLIYPVGEPFAIVVAHNEKEAERLVKLQPPFVTTHIGTPTDKYNSPVCIIENTTDY